ncbi:MAG: ATP-dependent RNA helicase kurz [Trebouxia sp. A1-2]|nr:MAG: ATP-dependent RNA helicase kurz [Trebouxia sp. A1-2]
MGQKLHSKRQRKQRANASLKRKQFDRPDDQLDDTLLAPQRDVGDSNALILAPADIVEEDSDVSPIQAPKMSKSQLRKQKKVHEEVQKRQQRAQVYATLQQHALSDSQHALIMPAHMLGQSETKRQQLRRALHHQRAGIALPEGSHLERERHVETAELDPMSAVQQVLPATSRPSSENQAQLPFHASPTSVTMTSSKHGQAAAHHVKRQKVEQPEHVDSKPAAQQLHEARSVAAATKQQLGLTGADEEKPKQADLLPMATGPARVVHVQHRPDIEAVRGALPITGMEQEVMEAVLQNDVVVLCGETGCGKTTQVPQFLYEAGYGCSDFPDRAGMIGVTQPRRVAAVSTATRVADELDTRLGSVVGYQVRYDRKVSKETALKFMTDGILLRELQEDFLLTKYSSVIIDEAHERSLNTDLLLGLLSRVVPLRRSMSQGPASTVQPLKLLIMSATLRIDDFTANRRLFPTAPPVVRVPARQFPVTVHFNRRTELDDFVGAAYQKVCKIHRQLPLGGILVFLTGQREVELLCKRLRQAFAPKPLRPPRPLSQQTKDTVPVAPRSSPHSPITDTLLKNDWPGKDATHAVNQGQQAASKQTRLLTSTSNNTKTEIKAWVKAGVATGPEGQDDNEVQAKSEQHHRAKSGGLKQPGSADHQNDLKQQNGLDDLEQQDGLDDLYGGDAVEAAGEGPDDGPSDDDDEAEVSSEDMDSEEEDTPVVGGEGFTPEELAQAEQNFTTQLRVSPARGKEQEQGTGLVHVLPLYANLPRSAQARVFEAPPAGSRFIVVATNVAETSLTIPGMRYVVDGGRSKQKILQEGGSMAQYDVRWISKASAQQRAGRSGRTGPGHCYRLYSSAHFNDTFPAHTPPEILNTSLEGLVLLMKAMHVDKVPHFPFPTPPEAGALTAAQKLPCSPLSSAAPQPPHHPPWADMSWQGNAALDGKAPKKGKPVVAYAVALAAALSIESPFMHVDNLAGEGDEEEAKRQRQSARGYQKKFHSNHGDAITALNVVCAYRQSASPEAFCRQHHLHARNLREMSALFAQLARALLQHPPHQQQGLKGSRPMGAAFSASDAEGLPAPSPFIVQELRKAVSAGWADQVARRVRAQEQVSEGEHTSGKRRAVRYETCTREGYVYLHPRSSLHSTAPEFVVYTQLISTAKRPYMAGVTAIEPSALSEVAKPLCTWSGPLLEPAPAYSPATDAVQCWQHVTFGKHAWLLPPVLTRHEDSGVCTAVFATALLEGKALPVFQDLKTAWLVPPHMAMKKSVLQQSQLGELLYVLRQHGIDSRAALAAAWQKDPSLLKRQLLECLKKGQQAKLLELWSQALSQAAQSAATTCIK